MEPKVSVIIPTYNRPQLICRAIESALDQTYKNLEVIVINGDKTGKTTEVMKSLVEKYPGVVIDFIFEQLPRTDTVFDRRNIARNRNAGIRIAKGEYIAPLDDDDYWIDQKKIEKQVSFFESHPEYSLVSGGVFGLIRNQNGTTTEEVTIYPEYDEDTRKMMLMNFGLVNSTVVYRKKDWEKVGGYDEFHPVSETQDLHLKLGKLGKFYSFQVPFTGYVLGEHEKDHIEKYGRYCLRDGFRIIFTYYSDYPGALRALFSHIIYLLYTFVPRGIRKIIRPIALRLQVLFFKIFAGTNTKKTSK